VKPIEKCELCNKEWASYQLQTMNGKKEVCKKCATHAFKENLNDK